MTGQAQQARRGTISRHAGKVETMTDYKTIAMNLYNAALDMDFGDYVETREEDINRISAALERLDMNDINDSALIQALERLYT